MMRRKAREEAKVHSHSKHRRPSETASRVMKMAGPDGRAIVV